MKKLLALSLLCAFAFSSSLFAGEVHVEDCGAYAESTSRENTKQIKSIESDAPVSVETSLQ